MYGGLGKGSFGQQQQTLFEAQGERRKRWGKKKTYTKKLSLVVAPPLLFLPRRGPEGAKFVFFGSWELCACIRKHPSTYVVTSITWPEQTHNNVLRPLISRFVPHLTFSFALGSEKPFLSFSSPFPFLPWFFHQHSTSDPHSPNPTLLRPIKKKIKKKTVPESNL